jgi:hypothetical protein
MVNFQTMRNIFLSITLILPLLLAGGCKSNDTSTNPPVITPITEDLFPLVAGRQFQYTGYLVYQGTVDSAVQPSVGAYAASWTVLPGPSGTWLIQDSTTVFSATTVRYFQIKKDTSNGDFSFRQTLGPFYRAINASYTDTAVWIGIARPSMGIGTSWTAFDTTVTGNIPGVGSAPVHFQIFGEIVGQFSITDSSSAHTVYPHAYKVRTWRKITAGGFVVQDDATTAILWLVANIGPVQIDVAGDTENYGFFRVMTGKNF